MTDQADYLNQDHTEGFFSIDEYELYYRQFGEGGDVLLTLHGGPGMPHDYLLPLCQHGSTDLSVFMYDQFGVGRSDRPAPGDFDRYTVEHYRDEVEAVRREIDPDKFYLYGQSWGGMLALEYMLEYGDHVSGLILANTLADTASAYRSMRSHVDDQSPDDLETIEDYEADRAYDNPEYLDVLDKVYESHVCRLDEHPRPVEHTFEAVNTDIYGLMWGPNEYVLLDTARLRGWDVKNELDEIEAPTLVITGAYDEIEPEIAAEIADRIPNSTYVEFEESSHMPFWEQPDAHYQQVEKFLSSTE